MAEKKTASLNRFDFPSRQDEVGSKGVGLWS